MSLKILYNQRDKIDKQYVQGVEALLENGGVIDKKTLLNDIKKRKEESPKDYSSDVDIMLTYIFCQYQASDVIKKLVRVINRLQKSKSHLNTDWCDCKKEKFSSYPQDGECSCGMYKHHVHCVCGSIMQIG